MGIHQRATQLATSDPKISLTDLKFSTLYTLIKLSKNLGKGRTLSSSGTVAEPNGVTGITSV